MPAEHRQTMKKQNRKITTTAPVEPGNFTGSTPEFGRCADVQRIYGLRRGTLYNLLRDGKIKGVLLRVRGKNLASVCSTWPTCEILSTRR